MSSRLLLPCAAACLSVALASCGGGGGASSTTASAEPPVTDLLAWTQGYATEFYWHNNPELLRTADENPPFDETETGIRTTGAGANFSPSNTESWTDGNIQLVDLITLRRTGASRGLLRGDYASWGGPVNGIQPLINTESGADYMRENRNFAAFDFESGQYRSIMALGRYSAFLTQGAWVCRGAECQSYSVRAAQWGNKNWVIVNGDWSNTGYSWMRENGASATWRGAMAGSAVASGVAVVGEAAVSYSVSDDSVDVELTGIKQRDDGNGVVEATYAGPESLAWTNLAGRGDDLADYWRFDGVQDGQSFRVEAKFWGPNAEEAAGTFATTFDDDAIEGGKDRLVGGFVTQR